MEGVRVCVCVRVFSIFCCEACANLFCNNLPSLNQISREGVGGEGSYVKPGHDQVVMYLCLRVLTRKLSKILQTNVLSCFLTSRCCQTNDRSTERKDVTAEHKNTTMVSSILLSRLTSLFNPSFFPLSFSPPAGIVRLGLHDGSEAPTRATSLESGWP